MRRHRYLFLGLLALCGQAAAVDMSATYADSPASLRERLLQQEYFASNNHAGLQAPNRALGIRSYFDADGLRAVRRDAAEADQFRWQPQSLARGAIQQPIVAGVVSVYEGHVELHQDAVTQTFDNASEGLRAALRIDEAPQGTAALELSVNLGNARTSGGGKGSVQLVAGDGGTFQSTIVVHDAEGRELPLTIQSPTAGRLKLRVDDSGAAYPITVDTLITTNWDIRIESDQVSAHFATSGA